MNNSLAKTSDNGLSIAENVIVKGDLSKLSPQERANYYTAICTSMGLNPLTRPFEYIMLDGRLTLYARKACADQLRKIHGVSLGRPEIIKDKDMVTVMIDATDKTGRSDSDVASVPFLKWSKRDRGFVAMGEMDKANAVMKCVTKAKRRVTLSICGMGMLDETELETIANKREWNEPTSPQTPPTPPTSNATVIIEEAQPQAFDATGEPLTDAELVISETPQGYFVAKLVELIPRYNEMGMDKGMFAVRAVMKKLGYRTLPSNSQMKVEMFRNANQYASFRDADVPSADAVAGVHNGLLLEDFVAPQVDADEVFETMDAVIEDLSE